MQYKTISKHSDGKILKSDGFQISSEAKAAKKLDPSIIDGTLGTFYYEDGSFKTHDVVKEVFNTLKDDGNDEFREKYLACKEKYQL